MAILVCLVHLMITVKNHYNYLPPPPHKSTAATWARSPRHANLNSLWRIGWPKYLLQRRAISIVAIIVSKVLNSTMILDHLQFVLTCLVLKQSTIYSESVFYLGFRIWGRSCWVEGGGRAAWAAPGEGDVLPPMWSAKATVTVEAFKLNTTKI